MGVSVGSVANTGCVKMTLLHRSYEHSCLPVPVPFSSAGWGQVLHAMRVPPTPAPAPGSVQCRSPGDACAVPSSLEPQWRLLWDSRLAL